MNNLPAQQFLIDFITNNKVLVTSFLRENLINLMDEIDQLEYKELLAKEEEFKVTFSSLAYDLNLRIDGNDLLVPVEKLPELYQEILKNPKIRVGSIDSILGNTAYRVTLARVDYK